MKKLVFVLTVISISMALISGLLFSQLHVAQETKIELENEVTQLTNELSAERNISSQLENQITELETQNIDLQLQIIELADRLDKARNLVIITNFSTSGFNPWVGLTIVSHVGVTIHNFGVNDVSGLELMIIPCGDERFAETFSIDTIQSGHQQSIGSDIDWSLGSEGKWSAVLMLGPVVLDEYVIE